MVIAGCLFLKLCDRSALRYVSSSVTFLPSPVLVSVLSDIHGMDAGRINNWTRKGKVL